MASHICEISFHDEFRAYERKRVVWSIQSKGRILLQQELLKPVTEDMILKIGTKV